MKIDSKKIQQIRIIMGQSLVPMKEDRGPSIIDSEIKPERVGHGRSELHRAWQATFDLWLLSPNLASMKQCRYLKVNTYQGGPGGVHYWLDRPNLSWYGMEDLSFTEPFGQWKEEWVFNWRCKSGSKMGMWFRTTGYLRVWICSCGDVMTIYINVGICNHWILKSGYGNTAKELLSK